MARKQSENLTPGAWIFDAACPFCHRKVPVPVTLSSRVSGTEEGGSIQMRVLQQPQDHSCDQAPLPDGDDDEPGLDF
jgi:hypothetical protein